MKVLISGAGIAGPTLAHWLLRYGMEPILVEKAERLRTAGYGIDFWGAGFDVAERMDLVPAVLRRGYRVREVRMVGRDGRRVGGFSSEVFARSTSGRFVSLPRGDLAALLFGTLQGRAETLASARSSPASRKRPYVSAASPRRAAASASSSGTASRASSRSRCSAA